MNRLCIESGERPGCWSSHPFPRLYTALCGVVCILASRLLQGLLTLWTLWESSWRVLNGLNSSNFQVFLQTSSHACLVQVVFLKSQVISGFATMSVGTSKQTAALGVLAEWLNLLFPAVNLWVTLNILLNQECPLRKGWRLRQGKSWQNEVSSPTSEHCPIRCSRPFGALQVNVCLGIMRDIMCHVQSETWDWIRGIIQGLSHTGDAPCPYWRPQSQLGCPHGAPN